MQKPFQNLSKDKILLALIVGILLFLLSFPLENLNLSGNTAQTKNTEDTLDTGDEAYKAQLERELEEMLEKVKGAGQVQVMIVLKDNGEKIVEKDVQSESSSVTSQGENAAVEEHFQNQENTVMENDQIPWVSQELLPEVAGIAVAAEGGGNAVVKSEISSMLEALFGLPAHKIKVLEGNF